jgi:hypothetical protein
LRLQSIDRNLAPKFRRPNQFGRWPRAEWPNSTSGATKTPNACRATPLSPTTRSQSSSVEVSPADDRANDFNTAGSATKTPNGATCLSSVTADQEGSVLETNQRLSESHLWRLQRNYFEQQGIEAWRSGAVPHHITSSPFIAEAYARVVFGFLRDWATIEHSDDGSFSAPLDRRQPVHIIELGSGSGRFAYSFLKKFLNLYRNSVLKEIPVKYVMTDFTKANLEYWRTHPWLLPLIEEGSLDLACFDLESDVQLELLNSGEILSNTTLRTAVDQALELDRDFTLARSLREELDQTTAGKTGRSSSRRWV